MQAIALQRETERVKQQRADYTEKMVGKANALDIVCVDESGIDEREPNRKYGRGQKGKRVVVAQHYTKGKHRSLLAAIGFTQTNAQDRNREDRNGDGEHRDRGGDGENREYEKIEIEIEKIEMENMRR